MEFGEKNRISHRQLYRQIVTAFTAPFLLCLFGRGRLLGVSGLAGTALAVALLLLYVVFLIRLSPFYSDLKKSAGPFWGRVSGIFLLSYVVLTAAYLLRLLEIIVPENLTIGVPGWLLSLLALLACSVGSSRGLQRRGRMAGVSGGILLAAVILLMLLSLGQAKIGYLREMASGEFSMRAFAGSTWGVLCAFSGLGLLPFSLEFVEKQRAVKQRKDEGKFRKNHYEAQKQEIETDQFSEKYRKFPKKQEETREYHEYPKQRAGIRRPLSFSILTLGGILIGMELLLPAVLGQSRIETEKYPVLPLLAGADLPGNVLARFDVLWMGFLLFSLLFAVGSLFYYGHQIIRSAGLGTGRIWMAALVYLLSIGKIGGVRIEDYFDNYLMYFFVPGLLFFQILLLRANRNRHRKRPAAAAAFLVLLCSLFLTGCGGIEPEKRMYPLALGIDASLENTDKAESTSESENEDRRENTGTSETADQSEIVGLSGAVENAGNVPIFTVTYGMPDLPQATGQDKSGEENKNEALSISGATFAEIEELYASSQEKYLDMGHIQVLVLGDGAAQDGLWQTAAKYLMQEPYAGENIWVFRTENAKAALNWQSPQNTSLGEYLKGLLENRKSAENRRPVTLRELYHALAAGEALPTLPEIILENDEIRVKFIE